MQMIQIGVLVGAAMLILAGCASPGQESKPPQAPLTSLFSQGEQRPPTQSMLFYTTSSTDSPHRAVLTFDFAVTAKQAGHDVTIFLAGDGVFLMKDTVAQDIKAVGQPGAAELIAKAIALGIPIFV